MKKSAVYIIVGIVAVAAIAYGLYAFAIPQPAPQQKKTTLYIGTTNIVKTDNLIKDYYMGIFAACFLQDPLAVYNDAGALVPYLVNWSTPDSKVWTLTLLQNATWHDGRPVTAEDIAFTIMYLKEKDPNFATHYQHVVTANATDSTHVVVTLNKVWTTFQHSLGATRIIPKHVWQNVDNPQNHTGADRNIGCGPFTYGGFDASGQTMTFKANPNYWRGKPLVDTVVLRFYNTIDSMAMALKKGDIAATYAYAAGISPVYVPALLEQPSVSVKIVPNLGVDNSIWFNCQRYPYNITNFRVALSYALDYNDYIFSIAAGYANIPTRGWVPASWDYATNHTTMARNLTVAASMLDALGFVDSNGDGLRDYPNGTAFVLKMLARSDLSEALRLAELIRGDLGEVGIQMQTITVDQATFQTITQRNKNFDAALSRTTFWGMSMYAGAGTLYFDSRNMGWANVDDPRYLAVVDKLLSTSNATLVKQYYAELQDLYSNEMYAIPLYWGKIIQPYRSDMVTGLQYNTMYGIIGKDTWFSLVVKG